MRFEVFFVYLLMVKFFTSLWLAESWSPWRMRSAASTNAFRVGSAVQGYARASYLGAAVGIVILGFDILLRGGF